MAKLSSHCSTFVYSLVHSSSSDSSLLSSSLISCLYFMHSLTLFPIQLLSFFQSKCFSGFELIFWKLWYLWCSKSSHALPSLLVWDNLFHSWLCVKNSLCSHHTERQSSEQWCQRSCHMSGCFLREIGAHAVNCILACSDNMLIMQVTWNVVTNTTFCINKAPPSELDEQGVEAELLAETVCEWQRSEEDWCARIGAHGYHLPLAIHQWVLKPKKLDGKVHKHNCTRNHWCHQHCCSAMLLPQWNTCSRPWLPVFQWINDIHLHYRHFLGSTGYFFIWITYAQLITCNCHDVTLEDEKHGITTCTEIFLGVLCIRQTSEQTIQISKCTMVSWTCGEKFLPATLQ